MKKRIRLYVAYDGTDYCGWQIQPNGITIEEVLNRRLKKLTGEDIHVIGASRTDSGVHALGNIAVFDTESPIPPERMAYALNQKLPPDIVIVRSPLSAEGDKDLRIPYFQCKGSQSAETQIQHLCVLPSGCRKDAKRRFMAGGRT